MEYVEGDTLESIIKNRGRIEFSYAIELMGQILNGIEAAHSQGFIHRDLKPSNIILDLHGNAKIMDFGISKSVDELNSITQHNARPGTLLYMSPEQLSGNIITVKSDLYSLGVTFYEMLSGAHPYFANTIYEIIDAHVNRLPVRISSLINGYPNEVDEVILRAMNKSSNNSFNSASEFREALTKLATLNFKGDFNDSYSDLVPNEPIAIKTENSTKGFQRVSNILLFIVFIGLAVVVFNVVKSIVKQQNEDQNVQSLSYSQDYSKNPNYLNSSDWELIKLESDCNLNSILFFDDYYGFIAGDSGSFFRSADGGVSWKKLVTGIKSNLYSLNLVDDKVFIVGSNGFIGYIDKNSNKIRSVSSNTSETIFNSHFINNNIGFAVGSKGIILKTNDGGLTWQRIQSFISQNLFSISFSDSKSGVIVGWHGTVLKTDDGGDSWQKIDLNTKVYLKDVFFVNEFLGFISGGEGKLFRTENGGNDWEEVEINTNAGLYKINFSNNEDGIILSNNGEVFITFDAGKSWSKKYIGQPIVLNDVKKLKSGNFILTGNNGNIFQSKAGLKSVE
jgi:serine/threonine-protein kinase